MVLAAKVWFWMTAAEAVTARRGDLIWLGRFAFTQGPFSLQRADCNHSIRRQMKVGILRLGNIDWLGGAYYARALTSAVRRLGHTAHWVAATGTETSDEDDLPEARVWRPPAPIRRVLEISGALLSHRQPLLEVAAWRHGIDVLIPLLSSLGPATRKGWIGWIPDFQHAERPDQFTSKAMADRDKGFRRLANEAPVLALSSHHAESLAISRYPEAKDRMAVLRFPASLPEDAWSAECSATAASYSLTEPFVYLPNQFWTHKNHQTVFRAWSLMGAAAPLLVCTGRQYDHRNPHYADQVLGELNEHARPRVLFLGVVPRNHQIALYKLAALILNPSLYEGWSTTVEEARAFGKRLLLSELPVFREQAGSEAEFFPATAVTTLAEKVAELSQEFTAGRDPEAETRGRVLYQERRESFDQALSVALARAGRAS